MCIPCVHRTSCLRLFLLCVRLRWTRAKEEQCQSDRVADVEKQRAENVALTERKDAEIDRLKVDLKLANARYVLYLITTYCDGDSRGKCSVKGKRKGYLKCRVKSVH